MLILGRRSNQSIVFPNCGITVRILEVNGRVAKIGIEAPQSVEIMRGELSRSSTKSDRTAKPSAYSINDADFEQHVAPELQQPVLQFAQRLAEIRAGLHLYQQRRAAGDEAGADLVFGDLLNELACLDADSLISALPLPRDATNHRGECVSERLPDYQTSPLDRTMQILVVNEPNKVTDFPIPVGTFHGCQVHTVNQRQAALNAITSAEMFDFIVCNGSTMAFDELELVRTIRGDHRLDGTKVFMTSVSENAMEHFELSGTYRIDGWLERPLRPHDLWKHIAESQQFES